MENTQETKLCKHCQTEIPKKAKVCPNCKKKQGGIAKWIIIGVIVLALFGSCGGDTSEDKKTNGITNTTNMTDTNEVDEKESEVVEIIYTPCTVDEMVTMLEENALKAESTYQDQYVEVTGNLSVIDSDGSYISLEPMDNPWTFTTVQCYIQDEEQLQKVMEMKKGDTVTLKGQITDIGEVLGYQLDIDSIN